MKYAYCTPQKNVLYNQTDLMRNTGFHYHVFFLVISQDWKVIYSLFCRITGPAPVPHTGHCLYSLSQDSENTANLQNN